MRDPAGRLDWLVAHRLSREAAILEALKAGPQDATSLARQIYTETPVALLGAATRNVLAHLVDLTGKSKVITAAAKQSVQTQIASHCVIALATKEIVRLVPAIQKVVAFFAKKVVKSCLATFRRHGSRPGRI